MLTVRRFREADAPTLWALSDLITVGATADPTVPLPLPPARQPPTFPDLADIPARFLRAGGDFLVAELAGHVVGMGGIRPTAGSRVEVKRIRVHPATRRQGVGRALMAALEQRARGLGMREIHLDTADQPDALAFYRSLGYEEVGRERPPGRSWTLVYFVKRIPGAR